ncbi:MULTISPECIES: hypothetical protein [Gordonia]|nr:MULTISPECIES: hypothetical protein [Gordonia]
MTTLNNAYRRPAMRARDRRNTAAAPTADVFGVAWPLYKLHAVVAAVLAVAVVLVAGGSGVVAMWVSAIAMLAVWWGERVVIGARWDDGGRDHHARD